MDWLDETCFEIGFSDVCDDSLTGQGTDYHGNCQIAINQSIS